MYACICCAVTVDEVNDAIDDGADTIAAVSAKTTAGNICGGCHDTIEDLIADKCGACPMAALAVA